MFILNGFLMLKLNSISFDTEFRSTSCINELLIEDDKKMTHNKYFEVFQSIRKNNFINCPNKEIYVIML